VSKAEFLADIRAAHAELLAALDKLGRRDEPTLPTAKVPDTTWTAKDVLSHLIGYDLGILKAIQDIRDRRPFTWGWSGPGFDAWNETNVAPRRARPFLAVRAELETTRTTLLRDLDGWPGDAGPFGADSWDLQKSEISWLCPHEREHIATIAKLGAIQTR
jgi:hypothetical protein